MSFAVLCPFCAEPIREEAFRCKHCRSWLVPFSHRHKWLPGLLGVGLGTFLIYDGIQERFVDAPAWLLITCGIIASLYGLHYLLRSPRDSMEEGRKELFERHRRADEAKQEKDD